MAETLDDHYLTWLYSQVASLRHRNPSRTYWKLLRQLYITEFVWFVPNDDNRLVDGRDLRIEFFRENPGVGHDPEWEELGCSMLELLVALSRQLTFEAEGEPAAWFWHMLENLELAECNDDVNFDPWEVDQILGRVIWRTYLPNGYGGLFPLQRPEEDQRDVELWYQLSAYVLERS